MPWNRALTQLRDVLANLFPTKADWQTIVTTAGLAVPHISVDARMINTWQETLVQALNEQEVEALIEAATTVYPKNTDLSTAAEAYHDWVKAGCPEFKGNTTDGGQPTPPPRLVSHRWAWIQTHRKPFVILGIVAVFMVVAIGAPALSPALRVSLTRGFIVPISTATRTATGSLPVIVVPSMTQTPVRSATPSLTNTPQPSPTSTPTQIATLTTAPTNTPQPTTTATSSPSPALTFTPSRVAIAPTAAIVVTIRIEGMTKEALNCSRLCFYEKPENASSPCSEGHVISLQGLDPSRITVPSPIAKGWFTFMGDTKGDCPWDAGNFVPSNDALKNVPVSGREIALKWATAQPTAPPVKTKTP